MGEKEYSFKRLDEHLERAGAILFDAVNGKYVIISDSHKWDRKDKDFFKRNEDLYIRVLEHYQGEYTLVLNGDIEEGGGSKLKTVVRHYPRTFAAEKKYVDAGRYFRVYGNHDHAWKDGHIRWERLFSPYGRHTDVRPAYRIGDKIVVLHGHEGDFGSDEIRGISNILLRIGKRAWEIATFKSRRTAKNYKKRNLRESILSEWAEKKRMILIAGHTHRPMFKSRSAQAYLETMMTHPMAADSPKLRHEVRIQEKRFPNDKEILPGSRRKSLYFNCGACIFGEETEDGYAAEMTCIVIDKGVIGLRKWVLHKGTLREEWTDFNEQISNLV